MSDDRSQSKPPQPQAARSVEMPLCCDLVMKGGITSGVVYPSAAFELSKKYRFGSIGGASAGAIAAAVTAAAEYSRQQSGDPSSEERVEADGNGLPGLEGLTQELRQKGVLRLFKPDDRTRTVFDTLLTMLDRSLTGSSKVVSISSLLLKPHLWAIFLGLVITLAYLVVYRVAIFSAESLPGPVQGAVALVALAAVSFWAIAGPAAFTAWNVRRKEDSGNDTDPGEPGKFRIGTLSSLIILITTAVILILFLPWSTFEPWAPRGLEFLDWVRERGVQAQASGALTVGLSLGIGLFVFASFLTTTVTWSLVWSIILGIPQARRGLNNNGYGICRGHGDKPDDPEFTDWLHVKIQSIAGRSAGDPPLTFADLQERKISLAMVTTDLNYSRPVRLPFDPEQPPTGGYLFREDEWLQWFPMAVVDTMKAAAEQQAALEEKVSATLSERHPGKNFYRVPVENLPLVVAARMSLSFPIFISGVPVYSYDEKRGELVTHWFSDGGISSNFPIHFFDQWMPDKPTFGLTLPPRASPTIPTSICPDNPWTRFPAGRPRFRTSAISSARFWTRSRTGGTIAQMAMPGYRERVCHIRLDPWEGGMNINMNSETISKLADRGAEAGKLIKETFNDRQWQQHILTRYLSLMRNVQRGLEQLEVSFEASLKELLGQGAPTAPCYQHADRDSSWYAETVRLTEELLSNVGVLEQQFDVEKSASDKNYPSPEPALRSTSRI